MPIGKEEASAQEQRPAFSLHSLMQRAWSRVGQESQVSKPGAAAEPRQSSQSADTVFIWSGF